MLQKLIIPDLSTVTSSECKKLITKYAIGSRLIIFLLQLLSNTVIPDHDAKVFLYPKMNFTTTPLDNIIHLMLDGFSKWDAQYFVHIALYGYTYENTTAFFPLYPFIQLVLAFVILLLYILLTISPFILVQSILEKSITLYCGVHLMKTTKHGAIERYHLHTHMSKIIIGTWVS
ncbi:Mannosyltransferase (PIG-V) [Popillia japonica]|uniref:GPI mannosyltransferase 2 n=1 Tax=Popillia japonica TaxID=7064 RepID=A0AAW1IAJ0_POPJA